MTVHPETDTFKMTFKAAIQTSAEAVFMRSGVLAALFVLLVLANPTSACPNCKEAVASQPADVANTARGYNWSVMFMVSMPFTLLGTGAFAVVRAAKRGAFPEL